MFQLIIHAARTSFVATMVGVFLKHGSAIMKTTAETVAMRKAAFTHLVHQENSPAPITAASRNLRCATALMTVRTTLLPTRRMSDVLATLLAR